MVQVVGVLTDYHYFPMDFLRVVRLGLRIGEVNIGRVHLNQFDPFGICGLFDRFVSYLF